MKRLVLGLVLMVMCLTIKAQSSFFDNTYITLNGGASAPVEHAFGWGQHGLQAYRPLIGAEVGKWINPYLGLGLSEVVTINTAGTKTAFDENYLMGKIILNISNMFVGYGTNRLCDIELIPSVGWNHLYGLRGERVNHNSPTAAIALGLDFNISKHWKLDVTPEFLWTDHLKSNYGRFNLIAGLTYNIRPTHRTKVYSEQEYLDLLDDYNALKIDCETREVVKVEEVRMQYIPTQSVYVVNFALGSATISDYSELDDIPAGVTVKVEGYASPDGSEEANNYISYQRACAVANYLNHQGVKVSSYSGRGATDSSNRIVIVTILE